ncbi:MAG: galactokinase [Capsulimonadales bacterium]|nr:galactokinase [Capsulimonadales bacterium]
MYRNELIEAARVAFIDRFGYPPQACGVAPGRVELLGNHTDYNEGFVLPAAIDRGIAIAGSPREVPHARIASTQYEGVVSFDPAQPERTPEAAWTHYVKGVVDELNKTGATVGSFDAIAVSSVPVGAGVSSSAALLVATAQLLLTLYPHPLLIHAMELAKLCRRAENEFVGAPVGLLDQFSSLFGEEGHALFLDCRTLEHRRVRLPASDAAILIADTGVKHDLAAGGGYRERRAQCEAAAAWFAVRTGKPIRTLRDVTPELLEELASELDATLEKRARHIVYENKRVRMAAAALEAGNISAFGEMMSHTHESCRRFFENSSEEIDALVEIAQRQPGVYGGKLTGGGWGGCAVILHHPDVTDSLKDALTREYSVRFNTDVASRLSLLTTVASQGAEAVRFD